MLTTLKNATSSLRHRPTYFVVSVSLLALGIAAVTAIFTVVDVVVTVAPERASAAITFVIGRGGPSTSARANLLGPEAEFSE